ncbi:hypothetical protein Tco_0318002 [Tanacetum coccineum]
MSQMSFTDCLWTEVGGSSNTRVQTNSRDQLKKSSRSIKGCKPPHDRQKSYDADLKRKPMEFQVKIKIMLKVFSHLERGRKVLQTREVAPKLSHGVHNTNRRNGRGVREVKRLKRSQIPLVKVRWNSKRGPEFTWEREDQFKKKYPHLFTKTTPSSSAAS